MSTMEKSDLPKVARKRANKAAPAAAEFAERRGRAKENAELQSTVRTQSREAVSQAQARIREAVSRNRQGKLTALLHHISVDVLRASFFGLKKSAAPGVEGRPAPTAYNGSEVCCQSQVGNASSVLMDAAALVRHAVALMQARARGHCTTSPT